MEDLKPLGPEGMRARIAEIRARMDALSGKVPEKGPSYSGLAGEITADGTKPMNPFGSAMGLLGKPTPAELKGKIEQAASNNGIDPALLDAIVQAESSYDTQSVSKVGARGLTQLMPQTAVEMGVTNPFDPDQNLHGGAKYLSSLLKRFPNVEHAVAAYNAGPGAVIKAGGIPNYPETRAYVQKVMALYREKKG